MAKRVQTITELTDDLDGSEAVETISFGWRGSSYEIDLNEKNIGKFEKAVATYVEHARKASRATTGPTGRRAGRSTAGTVDSSAVRAWAREQGLAVSERGRISGDVLEQYRAAH